MTSEEKSESMEQVLKYLHENNNGCVSDAIYGFQRLPSTGSDEDLRIRVIEKNLMNEDLVIVTEAGNTNKTLNGYYYFILSPKGAEVLLNKRSVKDVLEETEEIKSLHNQIEKLTKENLILQNSTLKRSGWQFWVGLIVGGLIAALIQLFL